MQSLEGLRCRVAHQYQAQTGDQRVQEEQFFNVTLHEVFWLSLSLLDGALFLQCRFYASSNGNAIGKSPHPLFNGAKLPNVES